MRILAALCIALLAAAAYASSTPEAVSLGAEQVFYAMPHIAPLKLAPRAVVPQEPEQAVELFKVLDPKPRPAPRAQKQGSVVGSVSLPALLDHHRDLLKGKTLGRKPYDISVAGDPGFKTYFLTFRQASSLLIAPLGDLNRLRGEGIDITIEPGVVYHFHVSINIFNPVRGSTMEIHPSRGTSGPQHDIKTGTVLDLVKDKSYVFSADDNEYWVLHGTDVDPKTNKLTDTRSLLFIHEAGMSTKAWPVAESSLPAGQPVNVTFGDAQLTLTRSAGGQLTISN
ncbi:MAG: hypothetical protein HY077_01510 [Elusimicrobia bacterium]|nr:hypothetical protein [Elusimicrobiota bacterium]